MVPSFEEHTDEGLAQGLKLNGVNLGSLWDAGIVGREIQHPAQADNTSH